MPTTIPPAPLTVTVSETINLNGQDINSSNAIEIANISEIDKRIVTIPSAVETLLAAFAAAVAQGTFVRSGVQYMRFTNKDDTNFVRLRMKRVIAGKINSLTTITPGSGYANGSYPNVPLSGGTGSGAVGALTVLGSSIFSIGTSPGSGYVPGTYTAVPLTGGSGSGAQGTFVVAGSGQVSLVTITTIGTGYVVGDSLGVSNTNLGGTGSGFVCIVESLGGGVTAVVITSPGEGYTAADSLTTPNANLGGAGSGFSVPVLTVKTTADIFDHQLDAGKSFILANTTISTNIVSTAFVSFDQLDSINAQADTAPVDIEYFIASL